MEAQVPSLFFDHKLSPAERSRGRSTLNSRRQVRARVKRGLRSGELTLGHLISTVRFDSEPDDEWLEPMRRRGNDPDPRVEAARTIGNMFVVDLLDALPGFGPVRVAQALADLHIDPGTRLADLVRPFPHGRPGAVEDLLHLEEVTRSIAAGRAWSCPSYCVLCHRRRASWRSAVVVGELQAWPLLRRTPRDRSQPRGPGPSSSPAAATRERRDVLRWGTPAEQAAARERERHRQEREALVRELRPRPDLGRYAPLLHRS